MIVGVNDPVFSFQIGLCSVLGNFLLAFSEPLWVSYAQGGSLGVATSRVIMSHSVDPPPRSD